MANEIATLNAQLPTFMQGQGGESKEQLRQSIRLPRVKIVQPTSTEENYGGAQIGSVVLTPLNNLLLEYSPPAQGEACLAFTPIFFYVEWLHTNPYGVQPFIIEKSVDPKSRIARMAANFDTRRQADGTEYRETLNYVSLIHMEGLDMTPVLLTFAGAEWKAGNLFRNLICARPGEMFGHNYLAVLKRRANEKGKWFGFDISNPYPDSGVAPYVPDKETYDRNYTMFQELREAFNANLLIVDDEPDGNYVDGQVVGAANGNGQYAPDAF